MQVPNIQGLDPRKRIASLFLTPRCDMGCRFCASGVEASTTATNPVVNKRVMFPKYRVWDGTRG